LHFDLFIFCLKGIPSLIILSSDGKILSRKGRDEVGRRGVEALNAWAKGEKLARPSPDQYQWEYVSCDGCSMSPIIGLRYICSTCGNYDLCEECQKKGHQHELTLQNPPNDDDDD
jgi:hypothetical protein